MVLFNVYIVLNKEKIYLKSYDLKDLKHKMFKILLGILFLNLNLVFGLEKRGLIDKVSLKEAQIKQVQEIVELNKKRLAKGLESIEYNVDLIKIAQEEADRLVVLEALEIPSLNLTNNFIGFSFNITGRIANKFSKIFRIFCKNLF